MADKRILVGEIGRPHGVRGLVRVQSFTAEAADLATYGPLSDERGEKHYALQWLPGGLARIEGVSDRDAAARLTGTRLYVPRDRLPEPEEEEFYLADMIGLAVRDREDRVLGVVRSVEDFGAGSFLTVADEQGRETLLPFTRAVVPVIAIAEGYLLVQPPVEGQLPPEVIAAAEAEPAADRGEAAAPVTGASAPLHALPRRQDAPKGRAPRGPRGGAA
ncbi:ribosome maturation factor RimM [Roseomonas sp. 18066]|uniref:ribosome maturation factor RimM n=1 Tax=Roseomonas sp. 18066 TaxID=2681412 RepID=UPI00135BD798|nr:ribosome maturation factor RimM [Roseomonas sp. 18066]